MGRVLCIDAEPETEAAIRTAGHTVSSVEMGYRTGKRNFHVPPHEYDLIVCDLKKPACFDSTHWGPGANDNFHCVLVKELTNGGRVRNEELIMNHQLIKESQLPKVLPGTFGPTDVFRAISHAGVPAIIFVNFEWARRAAFDFPNWVGIRWSFRRTRSLKFSVNGALSSIIPELSTDIGFRSPLETVISDVPRMSRECKATISVQPVVTNAVGDVFGQLLQVGGGVLLLIPECKDSAAIINLVMSRLETLKATMFVAPVKSEGDTAMAAFWSLLHPEVVRVAKTRFESNHLADAVEAALKEVNDRVKRLYKGKTGKELDGADLMWKTFSPNQPVLLLGDLLTATGKDMQQGYMEIFAGAMIGIRNPKAHANITIDPRRAVHFLYLASLLMFKVDEAKLV